MPFPLKLKATSAQAGIVVIAIPAAATVARAASFALVMVFPDVLLSETSGPFVGLHATKVAVSRVHLRAELRRTSTLFSVVRAQSGSPPQRDRGDVVHLGAATGVIAHRRLDAGDPA